jgi:hypothetical protein
VGLGDGSLSLVVDPATERVSGRIEGALGPASISGLWSGDRVTATIRRDDPADQGFTGMLEAAPAGTELQGTMNGALGNVNAVRTATFSCTAGRDGRSPALPEPGRNLGEATASPGDR